MSEQEFIKEVVDIRKSNGVSAYAIAKMMGITINKVRIMENLEHTPRLMFVVSYLKQFGYSIYIQKRKPVEIISIESFSKVVKMYKESNEGVYIYKSTNCTRGSIDNVISGSVNISVRMFVDIVNAIGYKIKIDKSKKSSVILGTESFFNNGGVVISDKQKIIKHSDFIDYSGDCNNVQCFIGDIEYTIEHSDNKFNVCFFKLKE